MKFTNQGKQLAQAKKAEEVFRAKYQAQFQEATETQIKLIDGLKNERLGLMNQTHSLKQLITEMRTENKDLRQ